MVNPKNILRGAKTFLDITSIKEGISFDYEGPLVVVGASNLNGYGPSLANLFYETTNGKGRVILASSSEKSGRRLTSKLDNAIGDTEKRSAFANYVCDLSDDDSIREFVDLINNEYGTTPLVVSNGAFLNPDFLGLKDDGTSYSWEEIPEEDREKALRVSMGHKRLLESGLNVGDNGAVYCVSYSNLNQEGYPLGRAKKMAEDYSQNESRAGNIVLGPFESVASSVITGLDPKNIYSQAGLKPISLQEMTLQSLKGIMSNYEIGDAGIILADGGLRQSYSSKN